MLSLALALWFMVPADADEASVLYLANEGVLVRHGQTAILFDPLFNEGFGQYQLLPEEMRERLFAGQPPFENISAVFVSHHHDDHFSAADMLSLLQRRPGIQLYAPNQAVLALRAEQGAEAVLERVQGLSLAYGDPPRRLSAGALAIEAVRIPHSGWPEARREVENLAWRVTLDDDATVLHLGDADARRSHFESDRAFWQDRELHLALPPYWFLGSSAGRAILDEDLEAQSSVGIHVPLEVASEPKARPEPWRDVDLFTIPGESRRIRH